MRVGSFILHSLARQLDQTGQKTGSEVDIDVGMSIGLLFGITLSVIRVNQGRDRDRHVSHPHQRHSPEELNWEEPETRLTLQLEIGSVEMVHRCDT